MPHRVANVKRSVRAIDRRIVNRDTAQGPVTLSALTMDLDETAERGLLRWLATSDSRHTIGTMLPLTDASAAHR